MERIPGEDHHHPLGAPPSRSLFPHPVSLSTLTSSRTPPTAAMAPTTYSLSLVFRSASNLPIADINTLSSDPFIHATLYSPFSDKDKFSNPPISFRTRTLQKTLDPVWDARWDIANVPERSSRLHVQVWDEDPGDHDDRLGHVTIELGDLTMWKGGDVEYKLKRRGADKKGVVLNVCMAGIGADRKKMKVGKVVVRIDVLGKTEKGVDLGRPYTVGPNYWSKHFSPLIGKITKTKQPSAPDDTSGVQKFSFEANKIQLTGPIPVSLKHNYVGFAPFVTSYFTRKGLRGRILNRALHGQYTTIYSYDKSTLYGMCPPESEKIARQFLNLCHHGEGGRIFTYVITLDAEWRFTETGKQFGIDMLSKHSMHSDVSRVISYSGEFFVRRVQRGEGGEVVADHHDEMKAKEKEDKEEEEGKLEKKKEKEKEKEESTTNPESTETPDHKEKSKEKSKPHAHTHLATFLHAHLPPHPRPTSRHSSTTSNHIPPSPHLSSYQLLIDNDSGTYRPDKALLSTLQSYLSSQLYPLEVITHDCFDPEIGKLKEEHRKEAGEEGGRRMFRQPSSLSSSDSSISSSDEEALERGDKAGGGGVKGFVNRALGVGEPEEEEVVVVGKGKGKEKMKEEHTAEEVKHN